MFVFLWDEEGQIDYMSGTLRHLVNKTEQIWWTHWGREKTKRPQYNDHDGDETTAGR